MKKTRSSNSECSPFRQILLGAIMIWISFFALSLIFAVILYSGDDPTSKIALFSLTAFTTSGGLGTLLNKSFFRCAKTNIALISACLSAIIYLLISFICSGKFSLGAIISASCFLMISAIVSLPKKGQKRRVVRR